MQLIFGCAATLTLLAVGFLLLRAQKASPAPDPEAIKPKSLVDLDEMIEEPIYVKLNKKLHKINPIRTEEFFALTAGFSGLQDLTKKKNLTAGELAGAYHGLFSVVCKTITRKDVDAMTQAQCAALISTIIRRIGGETSQSIADVDSSQKKSQ